MGTASGGSSPSFRRPASARRAALAPVAYRGIGHRRPLGAPTPAGGAAELVTFTNADHAFFNDTGDRFEAPAAAEAYRRTLGWFDRHVAERHRRHGGCGHDDDDDGGGNP